MPGRSLTGPDLPSRVSAGRSRLRGSPPDGAAFTPPRRSANALSWASSSRTPKSERLKVPRSIGRVSSQPVRHSCGFAGCSGSHGGVDRASGHRPVDNGRSVNATSTISRSARSGDRGCSLLLARHANISRMAGVASANSAEIFGAGLPEVTEEAAGRPYASPRT